MHSARFRQRHGEYVTNESATTATPFVLEISNQGISQDDEETKSIIYTQCFISGRFGTTLKNYSSKHLTQLQANTGIKKLTSFLVLATGL